MVREKLLMYMTYVVIKLEKILIKICNFLENRIPKNLIFLCFKQTKYFFFVLVLPQGQIFNSKLKLVKKQAKM